MESETKRTSERKYIPDAMGLKILDAMERIDRPWMDLLMKERISTFDFGQWIEGDPARVERFAKIRAKSSGGQQ